MEEAKRRLLLSMCISQWDEHSILVLQGSLRNGISPILGKIMIFIILLIFIGTCNWVSTITHTRLASYLPSGSILYQFDMVYITAESRRGNGLMSSALDFIFQVERSGFQTWLDDCVVFLGKTPLFYTTFLRPGVKMGTGKVSGQTWWNVGGTTNRDIDWHPIQGKGGVYYTPRHFMLWKVG